MGRVVIVSGARRVTKPGDERAKVLELTVTPGDGDDATIDWYSSGALDAPPLPGDYVATVDIPGSADEVATASLDPTNAGTADPGEVRIVARDSDKTIVATIELASDGTITASNGNGDFKLAANGQFSANGNFTVDP